MNNEFDWIRSITPMKKNQQSVQVGIGDDAAIFGHETEMETVIAVDTMVEGVHFTRKTMPMKSIGHKALAVNISDIAAMGGIPLYYLVSISIPKVGWDRSELQTIYEGMAELASTWNMDLIGGDTVSIKESLVLSVTVVGKVEKGRRLLRSNAKPGDVIFVTGSLGSSAYGLDFLLEKGHELLTDNEVSPYVTAHQEPQPHVKAGRILAESGYRIALNDISDGIASEAKEIADASNVGVEIVWEKLPVDPLLKRGTDEQQENWVLYGGEDFKLIGTIGHENWEQLHSLFQKESVDIIPIGTVIEEKGNVVLVRNNKATKLIRTGYNHL
ncbi:thiamine-phosphate kinase [Evansella sp. AB-rgal1]|uniref:thiamine-phosphate kinase n=1 Tax=Evansella sp. AB-rgal1 TaxID=3242696 RepID=UPI00359D8522